MLDLQELELQRHREPVLGPACPEPHEALAALQHGPAGERLEAVKIGDAVSVGLLAPIPPERMDRLTERPCRLTKSEHPQASAGTSDAVPVTTRYRGFSRCSYIVLLVCCLLLG